jgi:hypothetical protein
MPILLSVTCCYGLEQYIQSQNCIYFNNNGSEVVIKLKYFAGEYERKKKERKAMKEFARRERF